MAAVTQHYDAKVTREDGWWMISIPDLDLLTQAASWSEVEAMARGVIAADQDVPLSEVQLDVIVMVGDDVQHYLAEAEEKTRMAEQLRKEALAANQAAARQLHESGWSYRLIGKAMHLTHQRAEQLVKGTR